MMKVPFLDLKAQYRSIEKEVSTAIDEVIKATDFIQGKEVKLFEKNFAALINVEHCIAVGNGTDALIIAMKALGIGKGDEVIVPANSFISSAEAVTVTGAKVVFIDVNKNDFNLDCSLLQSKISSRTKAIVAVHLYGRMCNLPEIKNIAEKFELKIIEDCAQAHLSEHITNNGRRIVAGTVGDVSAFSFYPGKNLGAYGDAGAVVTKDDLLAENARRYANHGRIAKYDHDREGINSRMDTLQACVLNVKLKYLQEWTDKRRAVARKYSELLFGVDGLVTPEILTTYNSSWHLYVIQTNKRDELKGYLEDNGISVGIHYPIALPFLGAYSYLGHRPEEFPVAYELQSEILSLPIYPELDHESIEYICALIKRFMDGIQHNK